MLVMDCTFDRAPLKTKGRKTEGMKMITKLDSKWRKKEQFSDGSGDTEQEIDCIFSCSCENSAFFYKRKDETETVIDM